MDHKKWDKDDVNRGYILTISLCVVVLFSVLIGKIGIVFHFLGRFFSALTPILIGCVIAYLLTPVMNTIKYFILKGLRHVFKDAKEKTLYRVAVVVSVFITISLFLFLLFSFFATLIPQLRDSVVQLYEKVPDYIKTARDWVAKVFKNNPQFDKLVGNSLSNLEVSLSDVLKNKLLPNMDTVIATISSGIIGGIRFILDFLIGVIVAVYILGSKDELSAQGKKLIFTCFNKKRGTRILSALDYINGVFGGFINGKIVDSIIIGILCYIFCSIVSMPYTMLVSVIIGVTNIIPFFGPFIGAVPSAILILVDEPKMCLIFVIFIIILQQLDGNVIGPLILGDSTGLSGLWVLFAILVGGNMFGFIGMIVGVPAFACIYTLMTIFLRNGLQKRGIANDTEAFVHLRGFDEDGDPILIERKKRLTAKQRMKNAKKQHVDKSQLEHELAREEIQQKKEEIQRLEKELREQERRLEQEVTAEKTEAETKTEKAVARKTGSKKKED